MLLTFTVMLIFVITMVTFVSMLPNTIAYEFEKIQLTKERIAVIEQAVNRYRDLSSTQRMPCPARLNVSISHNKFGKEINPCFRCTGDFVEGSSGGITCASSENVVIGAVPTKTLYLADDYAFDGWGNKFSYAVDIDMAISISAIGNNKNDLYIVGIGGTNAKDEAGNDYIDYAKQAIGAVVISHGHDGRGSSNKIGVKKACKTANEDGENCNDDHIFALDRWNKANNSFYDDIIHPIIYDSCDEPTGYTNATPESGDSYHSAVRNVYCNIGFTGTPEVITCKNGKWIGNDIICTAP